MLGLGYSIRALMDICGWDSVEVFWCYSRPCNRRKSRFATRALLRAQLVQMQGVNALLRRDLCRERGVSRYPWGEARMRAISRRKDL